MSTYNVIAKRWEHGWELHIEDAAGNEVGVTQTRSMGGAERMVRDYLALDLGGAPEDYDVVIHPELDAETANDLVELRRLRAEAEQVQQAAAVKARGIARRLQTKGYRGVDIAHALGVSTQRVSQLVKP